MNLIQDIFLVSHWSSVLETREIKSQIEPHTIMVNQTIGSEVWKGEMQVFVR